MFSQTFYLTEKINKKSVLSILGFNLECGVYNNGLIQFLDVETSNKVKSEWIFLSKEEVIPFAVSPLGDIFCLNEINRMVYYININTVEYFDIADDIEEFLNEFITDIEIIRDVLYTDFIQELNSNIGILKYNEVYATEPLLIFGGKDDISNYKKINFTILSNIISQTLK